VLKVKWLAHVVMLGEEYAFVTGDDEFHFIDKLPVVRDQFKGRLRWHSGIHQESSGALFSFHSGGYNHDGSAIYNFVARIGQSRAVVLHCRRDMQTRESMLIFIYACFRLSLVWEARLVNVSLRAKSSVGGLPAGAAVKLYGEFGALVHTSNIFFIAGSKNNMDKTLINSVTWNQGKAMLNSELLSVPSTNGCKLYLESLCLECGQDDRWTQGRELTRYVDRFKQVLSRVLGTLGSENDFSAVSAPFEDSSDELAWSFDAEENSDELRNGAKENTGFTPQRVACRSLMEPIAEEE